MKDVDTEMIYQEILNVVVAPHDYVSREDEENAMACAKKIIKMLGGNKKMPLGSPVKVVAIAEGKRCGNCNGKGRVWVSLAPDDGCYEVCDDCDGLGLLFSSEEERDKFYGKY